MQLTLKLATSMLGIFWMTLMSESELPQTFKFLTLTKLSTRALPSTKLSESFIYDVSVNVVVVLIVVQDAVCRLICIKLFPFFKKVHRCKSKKRFDDLGAKIIGDYFSELSGPFSVITSLRVSVGRWISGEVQNSPVWCVCFFMASFSLRENHIDTPTTRTNTTVQ